MEGRSGLPVPGPTLSPWQAVPSPYADHLTTPRLPSRCEVCIIGTGLSGIATAFHLLTMDPGVRITLLEARQLCSAATGRNGGHLTSDLFTFAPALLAHGYSPAEVAAHARFEIDNFDALSETIRSEGIACEYARKTHLDICATAEELATLCAALDCMTSLAGPVAGVSIVLDAPDGEASRLAGLPCHAVVRHAYSASLNPYLLTTGLLAILVERYPDRLALYTHTPVTSVVTVSTTTTATVRTEFLKGETRRRRRTVCTPRGNMSCDKIVYATNGYTSHLVPSLRDVIVPVRGQVMSTALATGAALENCSLHLGGEYLSQRPGGEIVLGGARRFARDGKAEVGNWDDAGLDASVSTHLGTIARTFGGRDSSSSDSSTRPDERGNVCWEWSGIMGFAKLGIPLVAALPRTDAQPTPRESDQEVAGTVEGREYVIAGFTGHGMPRIFLSARHIAATLIRDRAEGQWHDARMDGTRRVDRWVDVPAGYDVIKTMRASDFNNH